MNKYSKPNPQLLQQPVRSWSCTPERGISTPELQDFLNHCQYSEIQSLDRLIFTLKTGKESSAADDVRTNSSGRVLNLRNTTHKNFKLKILYNLVALITNPTVYC